MPRDWQVVCKECGGELLYSDRSRQEAFVRGQSPPERCLACRGRHSRAISRLAVKYLDLDPGLPVPAGGLKAGRLGRLDRPARPHRERDIDGFVPAPPDTFGIRDEEIAELLTELASRQVAVVVAGTGSGKSTFLPWRLLVPPHPFAADHLTQHGKIVVTQPRIEASSGIPEYVAATLHGSVAGPGTDIGYVNSRHKDKSDPRNKLVYVTDGTLVNMIRRGELHDVSVVVIDEAHERSLNIDLILALLRRELPGLPHLKVLIVSATIETSTFTEFFEPEFPVLVSRMRSKVIHEVYERWWAGPELPIASWPAQMPGRAASTVVELLRWMATGDRPADIPADVECHQGDILVFLTGRGGITTAIKETTQLIGADPEMGRVADAIELLPLYGELPAAQRNRALRPESRRRGTRYRVVFATNLAETSLTIDGIRHVVDTGLINRSFWDPATAIESTEPVPHSRHGLRQRRGRAGRTAPGIWHCLYTERQFTELETETPPEIVRAPLPAVLLAAAVAGVSDPTSLRWPRPGPPDGEVDRARAALHAVGALDKHGDPTPVGRELAITPTDFDDAAILVTADQAGCAIEAATVLAAKSDSVWKHLLLWSRQWPAAAKMHVDDVHRAFLDGATDDLDVVCRVWAGWERQPNPAARTAWARRHYANPAALEELGRLRQELLRPLQAKTRTAAVRPLDQRLLPRVRAAIAWVHPNAVYVAEPADPSDERASVVRDLRPVTLPRSDPEVVRALHAAARPVLDDASWVSRRPPGTEDLLIPLDRRIRRLYVTPLAPPERVLRATFCVVVPPALVLDGVDWLAAVADLPLGATPAAVPTLPGDRFVAEAVGSLDQTVWLRLLWALPSMPDPTVEIESDDEPQDGSGDPAEEPGDDVSGDVGGRESAAGDESEDLTGLDLEEGDDGRNTTDAAPLVLPPPHDIEAVLRIRPGDLLPATPFEVVVVAVTADRVECVLDVRRAEFTAFTDAHLGREVELALDHVRVFPRDLQPVLVAKHVPTGFVTPIDPRRIGTGLRYSQLLLLNPGAAWTLRIAGADTERLLLEPTQAEQTLAALTRLAADRAPYQTTGRVVDVTLDTLYIQLTPDGLRLLEDDPPVVVSAFARDLPQAPERIRLEAVVSVVLTWSNRRNGMPLEDLDEHLAGLRLPDGPWERQGDRLVVTEPLTVADWQRLTALADRIADPVAAARHRAHSTRLALASRRPHRIRVVDHQLLSASLARGHDTATISSAPPGAGAVLATPLGEQFVPARQADLYRALGNRLDVGDQLTVYYGAGRDGPGTVNVHLFNPAARGALTAGDIVHCRLGAVTVRGGERHVCTTAGVEGLAPVQSLRADHREGDLADLRVVAVPDSGPIRMSARFERQRFTLTAEGCALFPANSPGRRDRWDLRALDPLANGSADIEIQGDDRPMLLTVHTDTSLEGQDAAIRLHEALTGCLVVQQLPHHRPLHEDRRALMTDIADRFGCLLATGRLTAANGYPKTVVWIAAPDTGTARAASTRIGQAYPPVWISSPFRRMHDQWEAVKAEVSACGGRARQLTSLDSAGRKQWQAVMVVPPDLLSTVLQAARRHCPGIPDGDWRPDPDVLAPQHLGVPAAHHSC
ncbi:helicase-related protein [Streptomyces prunicolor]|uniref:DEAD/DEAH box helicase n=1 Tax=Streptomyces prunicolor TaxID=67348 RepID=UPI00386E0265|nr:helicase-related protein [Streptomyces prunicolor]